MTERPLYLQFIRNTAFSHQKMAFIAGPRQVGKTTLALDYLDKNPPGKYYNWDDREFKRQWIKNPKELIPETVGKRQLVIFDELHKAPRWKSTLKGIYDLEHSHADILVTGSAKLDVFRRGGDSLLGRYFLLRMHPFSMGEIAGNEFFPKSFPKIFDHPLSSSPKVFDRLFQFGGFPEPYLKQDLQFMNLWRRTRLERLIREDLLTLTQTHELALIESCATLIPERIGSPFSVQSLSEDLEISHPTAKRWLNWLNQLFYIYVIPPYSKKMGRSLKKQPKIYLWDWSEIPEKGARFENLIASHLLKAIHYWTDIGIGSFDLFYLRDKEKREVDFLVTYDRKPWLLVEAKWQDDSIAPSLYYYADRLEAPFVIQVVQSSGIQEKFLLSGKRKGLLISADSFLSCF